MPKTRVVRNEEHEGETSIQRDPNAHNVTDVVATMNQMLTVMVSMQEAQKTMMEAITTLQQEIRPQAHRRTTPPIIHIDTNTNEEPPLGAATPGGDGKDGEEVIADQGASATKEKQSVGPSNDHTLSNAQTVVTLKDVENLIMRSKSLPTMPSFDLRPPYPIELASKPYPRDYVNVKFPKYNGKDGNAREHISRFVDALGVFGADKDLALREFSKSLTERAYTWYSNLAPGSVKSWEQMANLFYTKFLTRMNG